MFTDANRKAIIGAHVERAKVEHLDWDRYRSFYTCSQWGDTNPEGDEVFLEGGALFGFVDTMVATICPPNPQVTVDSRREDEDTRMAARYREALINQSFDRGRIHETCWEIATDASVYPRGVVKVVWDKATRRPSYLRVDPRLFYFDQTARRWDYIRYAIEATPLTMAEFQARVKASRGKHKKKKLYDPDVAKRAQGSNYPEWLLDKRKPNEANQKLLSVFKWVIVYEFFDFTNNRIYHMLEGVDEPLFEGELPYVFVPNPFRILTFNSNMEDLGGMGDAQIIEEPLGRANEMDTLEIRFAQTSIPHPVVDENQIEDIEKAMADYSNRNSPGDVWRLKLRQDARVNDAVGWTQTAAMSPNWKSIRERISEDTLFRLGMPQYQRGVAGTSRVATDLSLINQALQTRQGRRGRKLDDVIQFMAESTVGLYEEFLSTDTTLPVRIGRKEFLKVAREHLLVRDPEKAEQVLKDGGMVEPPLDVDYKVIPYSPALNNKSAQLGRLTQFLEFLVQSPDVDVRKLSLKLLDLLDMEDIEMDAATKQQATQAQAAQAMAMQGQGTPPSNDTVEGGALAGDATEQAPTGAMGAMEGGAGHPFPQPANMG